MSRGLGRTQRECLLSIETHNAGGEEPDTFKITCDVYAIKPDKHGSRMCSDTQHSAVKRALRTLRTAGRITGRDDGFIYGRAHWTLEPAPEAILALRNAEAKKLVYDEAERGNQPKKIRCRCGRGWLYFGPRSERAANCGHEAPENEPV
jgi:hypothetical protein